MQTKAFWTRITGKAFISTDEQEELEERAAIMEFDGGLSRTQAEREAAIRLKTEKI